MKIAQYNDMMSYLTRQNFEEGLSAKVDRIKEYDKGVEEGTKLFLRQDVLQKLYEKNLITEEEFLNLTKELREQFQPRLEKEETMVEESAFPETKRENFAESIQPKVEKFKELVKKGDSLNDAKNKVIDLFKLKRSKTAGTPVWMDVGKKQLINEGILEDKKRGSIKFVGETEDFSNNQDIKKLSTETVEPSIKKVTYENKSTGKKFVKYKPLMRSNTVTVSGAGFDTIEEARKTVENYNRANPKKMAVTLKLEEDLKKLYDSPRLASLLETGTPDKKYLKVVQDILDLNVSQAEDKLKQLGEAVRPNSNFDVPGINKISEKKATNISNFYKSKSVSKKVIDLAVGESVGEKSLKNLRSDVQRQLPFPGGEETFDVDEAKAKKGSFRLGSKPYSIFGQVIDGRLNRGDKQSVDSVLSRLEENVQKALKNELFDNKGNKIPVKVAVEKYNATATQAEKLFNKQKMRNFKPVRIPKITLDSPDKAIANKAAYKKYKTYFDDNYKQLGYSFEIPKDLKPIPEIAADLKNTNSREYKNMIRNVKEIGKKFIKDINKYDEKDLLKIFNNPKFQQFRKFMPRLVSNDDFSERRYASANNIMSDATYVGDEEQTFAERNPITTGVGLTIPSAVAVQNRAMGIPLLKALANVGKYPFKYGFKAVGSLPGAAYFAGDTIKKGLEEGKSFIDAATQPMVGIDLLYPEVFKKLGPLMAKTARVTTPVGFGITGIGTLKNRARGMLETADQLTKTPYQDDLVEEFAAKQYKGFEYGGRVGYADGPDDPGKRKFMKIMGGLASLPLIGRFFKFGEVAAPATEKVFTTIEKLKNTTTQMPDWFPTFLDKFRKEGKAENVFKQKKIEVSKAEYDKAMAEGKGENYYTEVARTEEYKANNPDHMDYFKLEDTDELIYTKYTNENVPGVQVDDMNGEVEVLFDNDYSQPVTINYTSPGKTGPSLGRTDEILQDIATKETKQKGDFTAVDADVYTTSPDGDYDVEPVITKTLDEMMEGTTRKMEEYATGQKVKKLSQGEKTVIENEIRAETAAEQAAEAAAEAAGDFD